MEHSEKAAAQLNARFVTRVLNRTADIVEGATEAGGAWDVEEAIRQASREFREDHPLLEESEFHYGTMPLLRPLAEYNSQEESGMITHWPYPTGPVSAWAEATGGSVSAKST